jgi:opacity protein-like surface antigen
MYFSHDSWVSGVLQESISFATTVPVVGRLGGGISYIDEGTIESYSVDSSGTPVKVPNINPYGLVLKINWSKDVYHGLVLGVNASFLKEKLGTEEPFAAACDIGMQYKGLVPGLCLAIVTRNIGMEIKGYKIDKSINAGIGYEKEVAKGNKIAAEVDFKGEIDGPFTGAAGVEYVLNKTLSLRAGYELDRTGIETGLKGIRAGAGLQFKGVTLDYGYEPYGDLGVAHKISLGMNF